LVHSRASHYRRPGGPWDRGTLESGFTSTPAAGIVDDAGRLDGDEVEGAVASLAGRLRAAGVRRGHVVAWQLPNCAAAVVLYRACWRLGAVAAPVHHRLGAREMDGALAQVAPVVVVAAADLPGADLPGARVVVTGSDIGPIFDLFDEAPKVPAASSPARGSDLAVALFTSGSTGIPKAALHTHRGLGYKAALMVKIHGLDATDAVLMPAPLAHVSGLLNGVLLPATAGIPSVLMAGWDADDGLRLIEQERVTFMGAPPVFFSQMTASSRFRAEAVASLRLVSTGGASVSPAFVDTTADAFGCRVKRTYGSTEAPTVTTSGPLDSLERARDTDGHATGEVEITVHDPGTGVRLAAGQPGELWIRGPELFVGYGDAAATQRVVTTPGRWFRTGDLGVLDDDGWLRVTGRLSDIIIRAGENISASEVEATLEAHPSVRAAVAVPVPDRDVGERVAAFVETSAPFDLATCRSWFAERQVTRFKTPEFVFTLEALPVLAAGKPDRAALRTMAADLVAS
jgi:acyl-CoA synthetase (AMP-forming)/AMP-acid ligase II